MRGAAEMSVYLQPGCKVYRCEFWYRGERQSFSTGKTTRREAEQVEKAA
jgi:hypothetical protein